MLRPARIPMVRCQEPVTRRRYGREVQEVCNTLVDVRHCLGKPICIGCRIRQIQEGKHA